MGIHIDFRGDDVAVPDEDWLPAVGTKIRFHADNYEWIAAHEFLVLQAWSVVGSYDEERTFILKSEHNGESFIAHSRGDRMMTLRDARLNKAADSLYPMPALSQREFREFVGQIIACVSDQNEHADDPRFTRSEGFLSIMGARYDSWTDTTLYGGIGTPLHEVHLAPRTSRCLSMKGTSESAHEWFSDGDWYALPSDPCHPWSLHNWELATLSPVERGPSGEPISLEHARRVADGRDPWIMQPRVIALPWWHDENALALGEAWFGRDFVQFRSTPAYREHLVAWGLVFARRRFLSRGDDSWSQHEREQPLKVTAG